VRTSGLNRSGGARRPSPEAYANMSTGAYDIDEAHGKLGEPEWPELSMGELLKIAFKDRYIDSYDHPVLKRLRGEI